MSGPPRKHPKRLYPYLDKFELEFGLRVTSRDESSGSVEAVVCRFCECWGREDADDEVADGRKRKKTTNRKHWKDIFRSDNIRKHMTEQHPTKFMEYSNLRNLDVSTPEVLRNFFNQTTVEAFFEKRSTVVGRKRIITIDKSIVDVIVRDVLMPPSGRQDDSESEQPAGDRGLDVFEPDCATEDDGSTTVSCYRVTITNSLQFDYVVSLLAAGLSFRQITRVVQENRDQLGCASKTGCVSEGEASCCSRIICAIGLQILADLMSRSWSFAIASDVSTDDFGNSHLDVRIRFPGLEIGADLLSFHLLAIPLFDESHSGESLFNFFAKVLTALCLTWKDKLIGSSTDGAPNMTGCNVGFTTRLANAVSGHSFYRVWCLAHQLDLIVKAALHSIGDTAAFPFMDMLTTIIGWLRRQDTLIRRMGSKCPYYINVRWTCDVPTVMVYQPCSIIVCVPDLQLPRTPCGLRAHSVHVRHS